jgi:hypothetical protein
MILLMTVRYQLHHLADVAPGKTRTAAAHKGKQETEKYPAHDSHSHERAIDWYTSSAEIIHYLRGVYRNGTLRHSRPRDSNLV